LSTLSKFTQSFSLDYLSYTVFLDTAALNIAYSLFWSYFPTPFLYNSAIGML
jgi:hypothetical protein